MSGLNNGYYTLTLNGTESVTVEANASSFSFQTLLSTDASYQVVASGENSTQFCTLAGGEGVIGAANVSNLSLSCFGANGYTLQGYGLQTQSPSIVVMGLRVTDLASGSPAPENSFSDSHFVVKENGSSVGSESFISAEPVANAALDLRTVIVLDISQSLTPTDVEDIKVAAKQAIFTTNGDGSKTSNLVPGQRVAIYTFDSTVKLVSDFSDDITALDQQIDSIDSSLVNRGNSTNLYGAIQTAVGRWTNSFTLTSAQFGYTIVITDGDHNADSRTAADISASTTGKDIYAIAVGGDVTLANLEQVTGSADRVFTVADIGALNAQLDEIQQAAIDQTKGLYRVFYATPKRSGTHEVILSLSPEYTCDAQISGCITGLSGTFNSNGFTDVIPEIYVSHDKGKEVSTNNWAVTPDTDITLTSKLRWANITPAFGYSWSNTSGAEATLTAIEGTNQQVLNVGLDFVQSDLLIADSASGLSRTITYHLDTDGDGIIDTTDTDDDNDGVLDVDDEMRQDPSETLDTDGDGIGNNADTDDDGDGVADVDDAFPLDNQESLDTDGDGIGNNADPDDDNDGVADESDAFPLDASETTDTDGDGIGDNADPDKDVPSAMGESYTLDTFAVTPAGALLNVLSNDTFGLDGAGSLSIAVQPSHGSVSLDDNGTPEDASDDQLRFIPADGYMGSDQFTYEIADGSGSTTQALVDLTIGGIRSLTVSASEKHGQIRVSWDAQPGANVSHYTLLVNPDGASGYTPVAGAEMLLVDTIYYDIEVSVLNYDFINASYMLELRDSSENVLEDGLVLVNGLSSSDLVTYIKASNTDAGDRFGSSVSVSNDGTVIAVGAKFEDSAGNGVYGNISAGNSSFTDSGAVYVYSKLNGVWQQQAYIKAPLASGASDFFGYSVSLSGDGSTLAVGAYGEDSELTGSNAPYNNTGTDSGAVYIFTQNAGVWASQAYLKAQNIGHYDYFGFSVSLSTDGNVLAVGAYNEGGSATGVNGVVDNLAAGSGAAYVFNRDGINWSQSAYVKASNTDASDMFGFSVGLSGDGNTLVVGAPGEDGASTGIYSVDQSSNGKSSSGAVYVFNYEGTEWVQDSYVKANNTDSDDQFGYSVSVSADGRDFAVGAIGEDWSGQNPINNNVSNSGAVFMFKKTTYWYQWDHLKASTPAAKDNFGFSVSISPDGKSVVVGSVFEASNSVGINPIDENNFNAQRGAAYLFRSSEPNDHWIQTHYIKSPHTGSNITLGRSVAVSDNANTIVIGADGENSAATGINSTPTGSKTASGAVYVYR
ncbi:VWA domain-containing protein [Simiduia agarivorans]|uniref:VWA domain-containing protein n=1 Tax=Simiduia agarivorans TaxID=447471 RepID=UPI0004629441|nr:VWA domain-containing protein [Simiduia agarivorans]